MDNNFSNILEIFKRLDELRSEEKDEKGNVVRWKEEGEWKKVDPKKDPRGKAPNLSDKARRETEKMAKSIEQECNTNAQMSPLEAKLRASWEATKKGLAEYGMTSGGTPGAATPATNPADAQKDAQKLKAGVQSLKSAGLDIDPGKLGQALSKADSGADISNQDEKAFAAMAPEIAGIASNPQLNQQFKQLLDKNKQQQAQQQKAQGTT